MNIILFGGTGHLGGHIAHEVKRQGHSLTVAVRDPLKARRLSVPCDKVVACSFTSASMPDILKGHDVVISAVGKSLSPSDKSTATFEEVDLQINRLILNNAQENAVKKFVYISAFHAERYPTIEYFRVHEQFARELKQSGLDYAIIKPPALFSAFDEMISMAMKGFLFNLGKGDKRTNPIYDGDVARIVVSSINQHNEEIEVGGGKVYSRAEIASIIQQYAAPHRKVRTLPAPVLKFILPFVRLLNKNTYDKLVFFAAVATVDIIAPALGEADFPEYIRAEVNRQSRSSS